MRKITNNQIITFIRSYTKSKKKEKSEQQKQKFIIASDIIDIESLRNCVHNVKKKIKNISILVK